jgi:hypothetical protein
MKDIDGHRQIGDDMTQRKRTTADSTGAARKWRTVTSTENTRDTYPNLSLPQVADRNAIRELVDAYARCADRLAPHHQSHVGVTETHRGAA